MTSVAEFALRGLRTAVSICSLRTTYRAHDVLGPISA
jgi:hypothetical protein